jgi:inner membrane protein
MMSKTHAAFSVCAASLALSTADPLTLSIAAVASQLPDVDTSKSLVGRVLFPVSWFLEERFPHRTITHSFLATFFIAGAFYPVYWLTSPTDYWAIVIGYLMGWIADCFTKTGVTALYPATMARLVIPANPRLRLSTGSGGEYFLLLLLVLGIVASINLNSAGGIVRSFNALLAQPSGAVDLFQKEGRTRQVIAQVKGRKPASAVDVNESFEVVEVMGGNLLVSDRRGDLYNVGSGDGVDIAAEQVNAELGRTIRTDVRELHLDEQSLGDVLRSIKAQTAARVFITGELAIQFAPTLAAPQSLQHFNTVTVSGTDTKAVKLHAASLDDFKKLAEFDATGDLLIKVVSYE